jgi:hypothetical protein
VVEEEEDVVGPSERETRTTPSGSPAAPSSFYCPVSMELMSDPVMVATGHTYDRMCIERWISQGNRTCPLTGKRLRHVELTPNHALRNAIQVCAQHHPGNAEGPGHARLVHARTRMGPAARSHGAPSTRAYRRSGLRTTASRWAACRPRQRPRASRTPSRRQSCWCGVCSHGACALMEARAHYNGSMCALLLCARIYEGSTNGLQQACACVCRVRVLVSCACALQHVCTRTHFASLATCTGPHGARGAAPDATTRTRVTPCACTTHGTHRNAGPRRDRVGGGGVRLAPAVSVGRQDDTRVGRCVAALRKGARGAHAPGAVARNLQRAAVLRLVRLLNQGEDGSAQDLVEMMAQPGPHGPLSSI